MKAGLHLAAGVEGVAGSVDGEGLDAGLGKVRNTGSPDLFAIGIPIHLKFF